MRAGLPDAAAGNASPASFVTGLAVVPPMPLDPALKKRLLEVTGQVAASQPGEQETCYHPDTSTSRRLTSRRRLTAPCGHALLPLLAVAEQGDGLVDPPLAGVGALGGVDVVNLVAAAAVLPPPPPR